MTSQDIESIINETLNIKSNSTGKRKYYPSNVPEMHILNAMTGVKYPFKVGSYSSLRLYNVIDATTVCDNKGFIIKNTDKDTETGCMNSLYYDSPEQYMQHRKVVLDSHRVQAWHKYANELFFDEDGEFNREKYDKLQQEKVMEMRSNFLKRQKRDLEKIENNTLYENPREHGVFVGETDFQWHTVTKRIRKKNNKRY